MIFNKSSIHQRPPKRSLRNPYPMVFNGTYWFDNNKDGYTVNFNPRGTVLIAAGSQHTDDGHRKIGFFRFFEGFEVVD